MWRTGLPAITIKLDQEKNGKMEFTSERNDSDAPRSQTMQEIQVKAAVKDRVQDEVAGKRFLDIVRRS